MTLNSCTLRVTEYRSEKEALCRSCNRTTIVTFNENKSVAYNYDGRINVSSIEYVYTLLPFLGRDIVDPIVEDRRDSV